MKLAVMVIVLMGWVAPTAAQSMEFLCGRGLQGAACELGKAILRQAVTGYGIDLGRWRWVIVPEQEWDRTSKSFHVNSSVPAFSDLDIRSTYIESNLVFPSLRVDETLLVYSQLDQSQRLRWVVAHELGHIVCRTSDERLAESAAGKLRNGNKQACR